MATVLAAFLWAGVESTLAQQAAIELAERTAVVGGDRIAYRTGGQGPPLILIPGFTFPGEQWDPFLDELAAHFEVIVPNLPGHGSSSEIRGTFRYPEAARMLYDFLDQLGIERIRGIGASSGASILLHMAVQEPSRMEGMVLVAGAHRVSDAGRESIQGLKLEDMPDTLQAYYRRYHPGGESQIRTLFEHLRSLPGNPDNLSLSLQDLASIRAKTLLVWGDRDLAYPIAAAVELFETIPEASLWVVPGQGHTPIWPWLGGSPEAASIFAEVVRGFLKDQVEE